MAAPMRIVLSLVVSLADRMANDSSKTGRSFANVRHSKAMASKRLDVLYKSASFIRRQFWSDDALFHFVRELVSGIPVSRQRRIELKASGDPVETIADIYRIILTVAQVKGFWSFSDWRKQGIY